MWSFIKDKRTDQCVVASLKLNDETKSKDKATILNDYFISVFTKEDESSNPRIPLMLAIFLIYCQLIKLLKELLLYSLI